MVPPSPIQKRSIARAAIKGCGDPLISCSSSLASKPTPVARAAVCISSGLIFIATLWCADGIAARCPPDSVASRIRVAQPAAASQCANTHIAPKRAGSSLPAVPCRQPVHAHPHAALPSHRGAYTHRSRGRSADCGGSASLAVRAAKVRLRRAAHHGVRYSRLPSADPHIHPNRGPPRGAKADSSTPALPSATLVSDFIDPVEQLPQVQLRVPAFPRSPSFHVVSHPPRRSPRL